MIESFRGLYPLLGKARRLGRGIRIERRTFDVAAARPESRADHLMRIGLARHGIGAHALRSPPPGEPRHTEIKASPEEMYRTVLADKPRPEFLKDVIARDQYLPEALRMFRIVRGMLGVAGKTHRVRHLNRHSPDFHLNTDRSQRRHELRIEIRDRLRLQRQSLRHAPTGLDDKFVIDEVELHVKVPVV